MPKKFLLAFILSAAFFTLSAQNVTVTIRDASGEALTGITITAADKSRKTVSSAVSDEMGKAELSISNYPASISIEDLFWRSEETLLTSVPAGTITLQAYKKNAAINEVVVTGVGRPTRLDEAVSSYRIISADDIRAMGAVTLNDALRNQLGINISQDGVLGSQINMRGLSGSNIKILIDGLPVNGREGSNIDLSQLNLANIERVEIVQGPMNVMYGSDGIGGVYNLITKTNQKSASAGANAYYESVGRYNFGFDLSKAWGKHNLSVNGTRNFSQGWDPNYDTVRNPSWKPKEQYIGNLKYTYRLSENATITYGLDFVRENLTIKGPMPEYYFEDNRTAFDTYLATTRLINRLQLKWRTGANGYWESNNSYARYYRKRTTYLTDLSTLDRKLSTNDGDQSVNSFDNITSRTTYNNKTGIFNYTFGYDINLEFAKGVEKIKDGNKFIGDYALFLTADIKAFNTLTLQPGFRIIHNTVYQAPLSPSLSLLYKPARQLQVRGSYSRGFRAPALKELYLNFFDTNHDIIGNSDLQAEYSHHYQVSTGYTFFERNGNSFTTTITGYYDDVRNQILLADASDSLKEIYGVDTGEVLYIYSNVGRSRILVLQLNNELKYNNLHLTAGMSYTKSFQTLSYDDNGEQLAAITPSFHYFELNGSARYEIKKWKAGISLFYKYTGSQPQLGMIDGGSIFGNKRTNDYHNIDISAEKRFWKDRIQLTAGIRNLANISVLGFSGVGSGGTGGSAHSSGRPLLTTGRSFFSSLRIQLSK